MKKILTLLAFFSLVIVTTAFSPGPERIHTTTVQKVSYVYICNSSTAYVYHSSESCRGLRRCTHEVVRISLADAVNKYKRRACKICESKMLAFSGVILFNGLIV